MLHALVAFLVMTTASDVAQAKVHYRAGSTHYELGNYSEAIREFAAGYALAPRPEFLINLGQAYRANKEPQKAREMFLKYLEKAPPRAPERKQVEALVAELKDQQDPVPEPVIIKDAPVREPPPVVAEPEQPPVTVPAPVAAVTAPAEKPITPLVWIIPVGVVVVAGAVVGGVLAANAVTCTGAGALGCVDVRTK